MRTVTGNCVRRMPPVSFTCRLIWRARLGRERRDGSKHEKRGEPSESCEVYQNMDRHSSPHLSSCFRNRDHKDPGEIREYGMRCRPRYIPPPLQRGCRVGTPAL